MKLISREIRSCHAETAVYLSVEDDVVNKAD